MTPIPWRLAPLDDTGLPAVLLGALPDPAASACELCEARPSRPLSTVLVIERPGELPVPFLICAACRRALAELRVLLASAGGAQPRPGPPG